MNRDLVKKLADQAGVSMCGCGCVMPTRQTMQFAELIVQECAQLFEDSGSMSSMSEHIHNNRVNHTILEHFGIKGKSL